ncbi:MAG: glycosyltransferase family 39 protein, partial [Anaerolineae bacterium]|nr:glycosyltransferase family 39 protein [Anaerolineae bacterium]
LLNIWQKFAGRHLFSEGLLSIFCGIHSIAGACRLASISGNRDIATVAAILTAFVAYLIFYAQLVRMYSLLSLLVAIVAWAYWKAISTAKAPSAWGWALLVVSSAALIYVHYYGIIVLAAIGLYHMLFAAKDKRWLQVCAAMIVAGLA